MPNRAPQFLLVVLLASAIGGGLWWMRAGSDPPQTDGLSPASDESAAPAPGPAGELETSRTSASIAPVEGTPATEVPAGARENFALEDARWAVVTIVRPPGTPADEVLELIAFDTHEDDGGESVADEPGLTGQLRRYSQPVAAEVRRAARELEEGRRWSLREATGAPVRVPFAAGVERGWLVLAGRYLFLEKAVEVTLGPADTAVTLEPYLGARVEGELRVPAAAATRGIDAATLRGEVVLGGGDFGGRRAGQARQLRATCRFDGADGDLVYAFDALPADMTYFVMADPERLAAYEHIGIALTPGETTRLDFDLTLGVTATGRVVDEAGAPVAGATAYPTGGGRILFGNEHLPRAESGVDGRFRLEGVVPGTIRVRAGHEDLLSFTAEPFDAEDGAEHEVGDLPLKTGATLVGTVHWPDGRAADGAQVRIFQRFDGDLHEIEETASDATGAFELTGLRDGTFSVAAALGPDGATKGAGVWRATRENVEHAAACALVLVEPLGIAGIVRDDLGDPIGSFRVAAKRRTDGDWRGYARVFSDFESEDGTFLLTGVYAGEHRVVADAEGYVATGDGIACTLPQDGGPITVTLARAGSVSGSVVDPSGRPIAHARVYARTGTSSTNMGWASGADTVETDANGAFTLTGLEPAGHAIGAGHTDWADAVEVTVDVEPGEEHAGVALALRVGGTIVGNVYDGEGFPMARQQVVYGPTAMMGFGAGGFDQVDTDAAGAFRFEHVTPGEWYVSANPSIDEQMQAMRDGDQAAMVDFMSRILTEKVAVEDGMETYVRLGATPRVPVRLFGRITRTGEPVATEFYAVAEGGSLLSGMKMAKSDASGEYEVTLERPGAYLLGVESGHGTVEFAVDVPEAEAFELAIELPTGAIQGAVRGPGGSPIASARVALFAEDAEVRLSRLDGFSRRTGEDGSFAFRGLRAGRYTLRTGAEGELGGTVSDTITLEDGEERTGIELQLARAGSITGTVRDAGGTPAAEVDVYVRDAAGRLLSPFPRATTDALGRFTYAGVAPGRVTVSARGADAASGDGEPVEVHADQTAEVELVLEPATTLEITVRDAEGTDLRAGVSVTDRDGHEMTGMLSRDFFDKTLTEGVSTRILRVGPLAPGRYTILATTPDGRSKKKRVTVKGSKPMMQVRLKVKG
ncbi:MAG: hypothetical protein GY711_03055 [bacterium]|nr:hypothetical protein [bacterium]